jgi:ATP-dependent DNA ligase
MPSKSFKLPAFIAPQLPVLSAEPPTGSGWIHEIKHDGFRTLIAISGKDAHASPAAAWTGATSISG